MNYLDIINKCLVELNYKQVSSFNELTKSEHLKLKNIINIINTEVCNSEKWNFLLRKSTVSIPANTMEAANNINGKIAMVTVDNVEYKYFDNFEMFFTNSQPSNVYTSFNNKLLFPQFDETKTAQIIYYTTNCVKDTNNTEKATFTASTDISLIPDAFAEPVLTYGACLRLKGNPQHIRFSYWLSMYKDAIANMRSNLITDVHEEPNVKLFRN